MVSAVARKNFRLHESLQALERLKGKDDHQEFISALHSREVRLLQRLPPAANSYSGALDTILFRGTLLVAYASHHTAVIALGADLSVLRQIHLPIEVLKRVGPRTMVTSVAFRPADAALAVGICGHVILFHGWYDGQDPLNLWNTSMYESIIRFGDENDVESATVSTVSFSLDSRRICLIGNGMEVFQTRVKFDQNGKASGPIVYKSVHKVTSEDSCKNAAYTIGSIAPRGNLVVAAKEGSTTGRVWHIGYPGIGLTSPRDKDADSLRSQRKAHSMSAKNLSSMDASKIKLWANSPGDACDISFGRSGVSCLSWKPRGGGRAALLVVDVDGQMHIFAKVPRSAAADSWMEEVARTPHMEGVGRCGGTFTNWGGGGGAAPDENDALGTAASREHINLAAPRPSRCYHWVIMAAGKDLKTWRASGLDDRPKAAFTRLEPGAHGGESVSYHQNSYNPGEKLHVVAIKSVAPVPYTCMTEENSRLVKSYAISNNERRVRSPEPPEPPHIMASFSLAVLNGQCYLSRWDQCPTSRSSAVCNARAGVGHKSSIHQIVVAPISRFSSSHTSEGVSVLSLGLSGEALLWSIKTGSPFAPLSVAGRLKGPHSAICFPSMKFARAIAARVDMEDPVAVVLGVDTLTNSLNLYTLRERPRLNAARKTFSPFPFARTLSQAEGPGSKVTKLLVAPDREEDDEEIILGLTEGGREIAAWAADPNGQESIRKVPVRLDGDFSVPITTATVATTVAGQCELICGGSDGRIRVYTVSHMVEGAEEFVCIEDLTALRCEEAKAEASPVVELASTPIASRIAALQADGTLTVFAMSSMSGSGWRREMRRKDLGVREDVDTGCLSFGVDISFTLHLALGSPIRKNGIRIFTREQGLDWKEPFKLDEVESFHETSQPNAFVMPGVLVSSDGPSMFVYSTSSGSPYGDKNSATMLNPYNALNSMLWIGRHPVEVVNVLSSYSEQITTIDVDNLIKNGIPFRPRPASLRTFFVNSEPALGRDAIKNLRTFADALKKGVKVYKVDRSQHQLLLSVIESCALIGDTLTSLDRNGANFALTARAFLNSGAIEAGEHLHPTSMANALHSTSVDALIETFVQNPMNSGHQGTLSWQYCQSIGVGWWVRTATYAKTLAERIAKNLYLKKQDPDDCAMWYIFLGKARTLSALYRSKGNTRMFEFYKRDFSIEENRLAAAKNAFVLVSKHRFELAAGFFYLAGDYASATQIVRSRVNDNQLALLLARLVVVGDDSLVNEVLESIAKHSASIGNHHEEAMALWLLGRKHESLSAATLASKVPDATSEEKNKNGLKNGNLYDGRLELKATLCALNHVLAIGSSPAMRSDPITVESIIRCRAKAAAALTAEGSPIHALAALLEVIGCDSNSSTDDDAWIRQLTTHVTRRALAWRSVAHASATHGRDNPELLSNALLSDARLIADSPVGFSITKHAALSAAQDLSLTDEVDSAVALAVAALSMSKDPGIPDPEESRMLSELDVRRQLSIMPIKASRRPVLVFEEILRKITIYSMYHTSAMFSHIHTLGEEEGSSGGIRALNSKDISRIRRRLQSAIRMLQETSGPVEKSFRLFEGDMVRALHLLELFQAFLDGDWIGMRGVLSRATQDLNQIVSENNGSEAILSMEDIAPENFAEELRQVADNPLMQSRMMRKKDESGRTRRLRISQHFSRGSLRELLHERHSSEARKLEASTAENATLRMSDVTVDPKKIKSSSRSSKLIKEQSLLSSTLSAAAFAALTSCIAQMASAWRRKRLTNSRPDLSILTAAEAIDALAMDSVYGWYPLLKFGRDSTRKDLSDEEVSYFAALWKSMASIPDFASFLREAATLAAAVDATLSAPEPMTRNRGTEYLDNPYPVRFSAAATGPWSGRGKFSVLFREDGALIRSLCVASSDPPLVALCTPRGIQRVIPSSYAPAKSVQDDFALSPNMRSPSFARSNSWSFFESEYEPFVLAGDEGGKPNKKPSPEAVTLSETEATSLASHPRRRRFASGGVDGLVRLWSFDEKVSYAGLRDRNHGRVVSLQFSAYGDGLLCTYANGYAAIWHDPDVYQSHGSGIHEGDAVLINAFGNRRASDAIFLDERNLIAIVGDPTGAQGGASSSIGHSLRVFDIRESSGTMRATWTARIHTQSEARSLALLEDRIRIVTGGCDGSLSVVDARTRTCVAELPAHDDEVICLRMETPRGRALASGCRNGDIKIWDARTLRVLDFIPKAHNPTRQWLTGTGFGGLVGLHGVRDLYLTDRALLSCGGDGLVKVWGPGWGDFDHQVL